MKLLCASLAALALAACVCLSGAAEAAGRSALPMSRATTASWHSVAQHYPVPHWARRYVHHRRHAIRSVASRHAITVATYSVGRHAPTSSPASNIVDSAVGAVWGGASDVVTEAARYVGSGKFTSLPGAWCADAVSAWLRATGHAPLPGHMAASALAYGPRSIGRPGDLVVLGRYRAYHVGVVEAIDPSGAVHIISGNWGHHVARGVVPRRAVMAFVGVL